MEESTEEGVAKIIRDMAKKLKCPKHKRGSIRCEVCVAIKRIRGSLVNELV